MLMTSRRRGFTLIELMVTITVAAMLLTAAIPSIGAWIASARVRSVAESLQNGLRLAQSEAVTRSQQTVFALTTGTPAWNATPVTNGSNWAIHVQPRSNSVEASATATATTHPFVQGSTYATQAGITITGPALLCLNSLGRVISSTTNAIPNAGTATCNTGTTTYQVSKSGADASVHRYNVVVSPGGRVRMCDAEKTLSNNAPDGC